MIGKINGRLGEYEKDFVKIKSSSGDNLSLNKILKLNNLKVIDRSIFQEDSKYYPQVFLNESLYIKYARMLEYNRIYILEGVDVNKTVKSYWKSVIFVIVGIS